MPLTLHCSSNLSSSCSLHHSHGQDQDRRRPPAPRSVLCFCNTSSITKRSLVVILNTMVVILLLQVVVVLGANSSSSAIACSSNAFIDGNGDSCRAGARTSSSSAAATTTNQGAQQHLFYVIGREAGQIRSDLPVWASKVQDPFRLGRDHDDDNDNDDDDYDYNDRCHSKDKSSSSGGRASAGGDAVANQSSRNRRRTTPIERRKVESVPGAFQLYSFLSPDEARRMVDTFEALGFTEDAAVSVPRSIRHNLNLVWMADNTTLDILWNRSANLFYYDDDPPLLGEEDDYFQAATKNQHDRRIDRPLGFNGRFRVYKYSQGDHFKFHLDGSWPGARIVKNGTLVEDAFGGDLWSMYSFLIFLSDGYEGGSTEFRVQQQTTPAGMGMENFLVNDDHDPIRMENGQAMLPSSTIHKKTVTTNVVVRTPLGGVLAFPHGEHPWHCLHASTPITNNGTKYIIRLDVLFG